MERMRSGRANRNDSPHFYKIILAPLSEELRIPPNFVKHVTEEVAEIALLKGPCGKNWSLKLREDENETFFHGVGWKKFQKKQYFEGLEFLLFHYDGRMTFHVRIFDKNGMER